MITELVIGDVTVDVLFKDIKNVHLSVYPPTGRVRVSAPRRMSLSNVRLFALSKIGWIRKHQGKVRRQPRETPREYLERESHYLWGRRYLLTVDESGPKPRVQLSNRIIELTVPVGATLEFRRDVLSDWYREELRKNAEPIVLKWARRLDVDLKKFYVQRMKTKWGSSNPARRTIRLNLELAKHATECLDYVALHEMAHFIVPNHSQRFRELLDRQMPGWVHVRNRLNERPLPAFD